ncbi:non-ribosomal peptide synthetase component F, partial [Pedobacter cryoconitis]
QEAGGISKFDLSLFASEHSGCLYLSLVYSTALFSESSVSRFGDYFQQMIKAVVADPGIQLCKLDLLSSAERSRLLELGKGASASYTTERTVVDLFCEQALNYPDATAIVFEDHVLTYRELDQLSNQLASRLQSSHQIAAGDTVGICLGRSGLMLVGILGILKAGGVYVPFDIDYPQERKSYICADAGICLLLTVTDHVFDVVDYYSGAILALDVELDLTADRDSYSRPVVAIHGESLAYISYTSGSTGNPKGVMVPHQAILRLLSLSDIVLDKNTVTLQLSSISFDAATFEIWAALLSGGKVVIGGDGAIDISRLNSLIEKEGVNTLWLTSGLLDQWAESDLSGLPLRYLLSGGDVVRASSVVKVYRQLAAVRIYNGYGPTENTTFTCCY